MSGWLGRTTVRRRRTSKRAESALESLETRILPAVDLIISTATVNITGDPAVGSNQYSLNILYKVKNLGTTPIDLTGVANDPSDNVQIRIYASMDTVVDAGDGNALGFDFDGIDNGPHVIGQNEESGLTAGVVFNARQTFNFFIVKVDFDGQVTESNENNNTFVIDAQDVSLVGGGGTVNVAPKATVPLDPTVKVRDLNTVNFKDGNFGATVTGAQLKDKFLLTQTGEGDDRLRMAGKKLKLGSKTIGTVVKVVPKESNAFQMSLRVEFTGDVNRDVLHRLMRNLSFRPGAKSTGSRLVQFQVKDNLENLSNVTETTVQIT